VFLNHYFNLCDIQLFQTC